MKIQLENTNLKTTFMHVDLKMFLMFSPSEYERQSKTSIGRDTD